MLPSSVPSHYSLCYAKEHACVGCATNPSREFNRRNSNAAESSAPLEELLVCGITAEGVQL